LNITDSHHRHGNHPTIVANIPWNDQVQFILDEIEDLTKTGNWTWGDIALVYAQSKAFPFDRFNKAWE
jgi:hypothetical protein